MKRKTLFVSSLIRISIIAVLLLQIIPYLNVSAQTPRLSFTAKDASTIEQKIDDELSAQFEKNNQVTYLVKLKEQADAKAAAEEAETKLQQKTGAISTQQIKRAKASAVVSSLRTTAFETQSNIENLLKKASKTGAVSDYQSFYIVNAFAITSDEKTMKQIAELPEVDKVLPNRTRQLHVNEEVEKEIELAANNLEWNIEKISANAVWDQYDIDGTGVVVANIDSGVQWDHPALKNQYRGYQADGTVSHELNWYDPANGNSAPYDDIGHGTHVMGSMVGADATKENQIGVAPGAKWIAVKAFTAFGGTDVDLLAAGEWVLAPKDRRGTPHPEAAPDIVNNSWGGGKGLKEWYRPMVQNWSEAGIIPVFAAGNDGPEAGTINSPGNYPETIAVASINRSDDLATTSSRGPSPYPGEIKPNISAPGVYIRSAAPNSKYVPNNGTSMAAPHITGTIALLLQANPSLKMNEIKKILHETATPTTNAVYTSSPNDGFGYGIVDAFNAVSSVTNGVGKLTGIVYKEGDGEDNEAPSIQENHVTETYEGVQLKLTAEVSDDVSVDTVTLTYQIDDQESRTIHADLIAGNYESGTYQAVIEGEQIVGSKVTYQWKAVDFGANETESTQFEIDIISPLTVGYKEDFETKPEGWFSFGINDSWEWGKVEYGPLPYSGDHLYGTNLSGNYDNDANMTLVTPAIKIPEGNTYLQFASWYMIETYYDFGHVVVSKDLENWEQLARYDGNKNYWQIEEVDLSAYAGEVIYIGFNLLTDDSLTRVGWYIDDVEITDQSIGASNVKPTSDSFELNQKKMAVKKPIITENKPNSLVFPIEAAVTVLETNRSAKSNPANGRFNLFHKAGKYTVVAESYGYYPNRKTVTIPENGSLIENFKLDPIPIGELKGTIVNEQTGEPVEGANILLVEDAAISPVKTNAEGAYSLDVFDGEYTLRVMAKDFYSKDVEITVVGNEITEIDVELQAFVGYEGEIGYDNGKPENARAFYDAGYGWAVKMSLKEGENAAMVTGGLFNFWTADFPTPGGTDFQVAVYDATGIDGSPGKKLAGPIDATALRTGNWTHIDLRSEGIIVNDDFFMVYIQPNRGEESSGLSYENAAHTGRSWQLIDGQFSKTPASEGNYMIRAVVNYEIEKPIITTPIENVVTKTPYLLVKGTATPTTTVHLKNNGKASDSIKIGEDGTFSFLTELTEGVNNLTAASTHDGVASVESEPISAILDTTKPELTIDSPKDGDIINEKTVIVEGTASDANLDSVEINGEIASTTDEGKFSHQLQLKIGTNRIDVSAVDTVGNSETKTIIVTVEEEVVFPIIENLLPSTDQAIAPGDKVKISFTSNTSGGEAYYEIKLPANISTQSTTKVPMKEVEEGKYEGTWTAPDLNLQGAVIEVGLTDTNGNTVVQEASGKLFITPEKTGVDRLSDDNRYLTAIEISKQGWTDADTVVLARGDNYADALAGVPYAHQLDAPILLTLTNNLYEETLGEIARLGAKKVVILGGESAISAKVAGELKAAGLTVERISGSDRFETAAKIASKMGSSDKVVIANGMDFPDALSVAAHAAKAGLPILLTQSDKLPAKTTEALKTLGATETIVVGGKTVVSDKVVKQLPKPTTLAGPDRYGTNIAIANHFGVTSKHMYVATGQNYADALTGAVLAAKTDSAVLLVHARVPEVVDAYITKQDLKRLTIFGGESAVSKKVANELEKLIQ